MVSGYLRKRKRSRNFAIPRSPIVSGQRCSFGGISNAINAATTVTRHAHAGRCACARENSPKSFLAFPTIAILMPFRDRYSSSGDSLRISCVAFISDRNCPRVYGRIAIAFGYNSRLYESRCIYADTHR
jgi:hypothetical protein